MIRILFFALILILVVYGLFIARHANEGDALFPVKVLGEEIEYALTPSLEGKAQIKLGQLADLNIALRKEINQDNIDKAVERTENIQPKIEEIKTDISQISKEGKNASNLSQTLQANIDDQLCALSKALSKASDEQKRKIQDLINQLSQN